MLIEIHHKHLVLRIAGTCKCHRRGNHIVALRPHASAVIHQNAGCNRDILVAEVPGLLQHPVLINLEIALIEAGNKRIVAVQDRRAEDHHVGIQLEGILMARTAPRRLRFLRPGNKWRKDQTHQDNHAPVSPSALLREAHSSGGEP